MTRSPSEAGAGDENGAVGCGNGAAVRGAVGSAAGAKETAGCGCAIGSGATAAGAGVGAGAGSGVKTAGSAATTG